jgi:hypothetical protein
LVITKNSYNEHILIIRLYLIVTEKNTKVSNLVLPKKEVLFVC